jgi:hypothetical protein
MPEWLAAVSNGKELSLNLLAARLALAFLLGCVVAGVYAVTHGRQKNDASMLTTLVLLAVLIAMVTLVIGNNVARAFSLAGALAIIRFRTVVEDTRDTAFVIFAVVVGMTAGAGLPLIALVGVPIVAFAAVLLHLLPARQGPPDQREATLNVRLGIGRDPDALLKGVFGKHLDRVRLVGVTTARQGSALDLTYLIHVQRGDGVLAFLDELNQIDGVQSVELRQP